MTLHLIDGVCRPSISGRVFEVCDPANGTFLRSASYGEAADVDSAVAAARAAAGPWWELGPSGRADVVATGVHRALDVVDELTRLQVEEMGQPISIARELTQTHVEQLAADLSAAVHYPFRKVLHADDDRQTVTLRVPYGVAGVITPWNFPLPVACQALGPLLAGGNTVVWKPAELSPTCATRLAEALALPPGVLNVVLGDAVAGRAVAAHPGVSFVSFTGSVEAGKEVSRLSGEQLRHACLELGGMDPVVVDADVDPEWAASVVAHGSFWNSGQVCTSMERIYVHRDVAGEFTDALVDRAERLLVGDPLDTATDLGPLASARQRQHVQVQLDDAVAHGARVLTGGRASNDAGYYFRPTVLTDLDPSMLVVRRETFGPLAPIHVVESFEQGVALASASEYALCATVLTNDAEHGRAAQRIPAAMCWVNEWQGGAPGMVHEPAKSSGLGAVGSLDYVTRPMTWHQGPSAPGRKR